MEILTIIAATWFGKVYLAGIVAVILYQCYRFSVMISVLNSTQSFFFCLTDTLAEMFKGILWPIILPLFLIQLVFLKDALDDFNNALAKNVGYSLDDEDDDYKD